MSELVPGTPEYKEAYDKEMQRLEAESSKDETTTSQTKEPEEKPPIEEPPKDELKQRFDNLEKALKDTQAWGTRNAQELARIKRERETEKHSSTRPPILDANPGLEDAIKHVSHPPAAPPNWVETVAQAIPDVDQLLSNQEFYAKASEKKNAFGSDWDNPLIAIRELSSLKTEHLKDQAVKSAVEKAKEQARVDYETKARKKPGMEVPGGSGGGGNKQVDEAQKVWDMSEQEFARLRSKTLGY